MELKFTARTVSEAENERGESFIKIVSDFSISTIALFIRKSMRLEKKDEQKAYDVIDEYLAGGKSVMDLYGEIVTSLEDNGFLDKTLKIGETFKKALANPQPLENNGQLENPLPSQSESLT